ncbi:acyl-protein synthetase [Aliiglaciecola litoralis]|uniref:Acyl-protein synthetase n=1 Tax=Aliiglaciecola litoralis TaxID=582857 RepID=A0ABN1LKA4_9ALTE
MIKDQTQLEQFQLAFDNLLQTSVYQVPQKNKQQALLPIFNLLHQHHQTHCLAYANIMQQANGTVNALADLPYLAVRLFKQLSLSSVPQQDVFKVLQSSGTTSQRPASIFLDKATSGRQSKVLVKVLQETLGKQRLPMLIIDSPAVLKDKSLFSARGAGIQGLSFFGRDHTYALDDNMQLNWSAIDAFHQKYQDQPVLIFGFTFMVWLYFIQGLKQQAKTVRFNHGVLLHSGGWKKLEGQRVDNHQFKHLLAQTTGVERCYNFYGMAEQVGSVFMECEQGYLHAPVFADVIIRDPFTLEVAPIGQSGLVQVLSVLPTSYPGHSILTEDLGTLIGTDDCQCGRQGHYFTIQGRLPKTEVRGCSDTHSA